MSEHIHEQISAFLDDELSSEESAFLVRRLSSDALAHRQTMRYATIGSVLREDCVLANSTVLRERIQAVLDGAPVVQSAGRAHASRQTHWARIIAAVSVAASVAVVALFGLRSINETDSVPVQAATVVSGAWTEPNSYVVPGESMPAAPVITPPIWLTTYLLQHVHYTSTLNRTVVNTNVIGKRESEPAEEEATEVRVP